MTSPYAFTPIPEDLAAVLDEAVTGMDGSGCYEYGAGREGEIAELEGMGHLADVRAYINGDVAVRVTPKGARYRDELEGWMRARADVRKADRSFERRAARRQWAIGIIGGNIYEVIRRSTYSKQTLHCHLRDASIFS